MHRAARLLVPALFLVAALTACVPGDPAPAGSSSASSTAKPSATPSASPSDSAPVSTAPACTRDGLSSEFAFTDGTAGHLNGVLTVTNQSGAACGLSGYPTVYVGEPEAEGWIGAAGSTDPADPGIPFDLPPGQSAVAAVTITLAGNVDGCMIVDAGYLVYAPPGFPLDFDTGQHVDTEWFQGCRNDDISLLTVGGFSAG